MINKYPCPGCKGDPYSRPFSIGWPVNKEFCIPCAGSNAPTLRHLRTWDNSRYTLAQACDELEKVRGINSTNLQAEVQALIEAGPTMPIKAKIRGNTPGTPLPEKKKLQCKCLHPPSRGVCVLGACVNVSKDGWIITINI
jgi:hypothetical protein